MFQISQVLMRKDPWTFFILQSLNQGNVQKSKPQLQSVSGGLVTIGSMTIFCTALNNS